MWNLMRMKEVDHATLLPGSMVDPTFHLVSPFASFFGSTNAS
jgi:hypothetical protein